ncbi:MAG: polyhydroxyalkanoate synthesis regulator DNA-binding domain-containing protein [Deltaproteobacteria bacterium]|nr:polyhydroxyalkanoate synthesis regulator DNA-binding domain-containing protein [Sandaracinaceae bacterium]MCX7807232.1 polyhydroxyalkanoate synthesis regulator DNA-binding domain-containing protein [Deltaproteobacteria bacterium]MDW8246668.1 polyhydroxyalkanoate synthesis regulator DNA-binding domain-containing protein [Sandaracinaceae bacterium]
MQPSSFEFGKTRLIKRYSNRKLYDTAISRYITLQEVAQLVKSGEEIRVIDNATKEDLTARTLAQILCESKRQKKRGCSQGTLAVLKALIQEGGELIQPKRLVGSFRKEEIAPQPKPQSKANNAPINQGNGRSLWSNSKHLLEIVQRTIDDPLRAIVANLSSSLHSLQSEIEQLKIRLTQIEKRFEKGQGQGALETNRPKNSGVPVKD